jgi:tyrosyl-tRNA synthetase
MDLETQMAELSRGVVDLHVKGELSARLKASHASGKPLRIKAGFDPTRPDLHLGHTVLLRKMRQFQDLGHTIIFLIGDYTAMVGDPTGRNKLRPQLTREEVREAGKTYVAQCMKVLDSTRLEVRYNSEWLDAMKPMDLVMLMAKHTVSRMLERNDFKQRFESGKPIYQHEFLYPLLQGYDSVALECDVELGGQDQLFNLLVGRDLMPAYGKPAQIVMTTPLLEGINAKLDEHGNVVGEKMSKSADNYVGIDEPPAEQYRKLMLVDDGVIWRYFELLSARPASEIALMREQVKAGKHPKDVKKSFASEIVARFHGDVAATTARKAWEAKFEADAVPDDMETVRVEAEGATVWLPKALLVAKLVVSSSQGKQLVEQGGVEVDGKRVDDPKHALASGATYVVRVGSKNRRFKRLEVVAKS